MLLPNETTVATPTAVSVYVWLWLQIIENIGISASLSAELTGQKWSVNGQKATNQRFVAFFIARKSSFQDFKSTVTDKVSLLNRYLFPAGQKR